MTTAPGPPPVPRGLQGSPLEVRSRPIDRTGALLAQLPSSRGVLAWVLGGQGLVGWGEVARLEVRGADRFAVARQWWREQVSRFRVYDGVRVPGSGPVAFGSFTFDDESEQSSVVVVPEVVLGRRAGTAWLTTFGAPPLLSSSRQIDPPTRLRYAHGVAPASLFRAAVAEAVRLIAHGTLAKVVLAHDLEATADEAIDPRFVLAGLADRYPGCWTFSVEGLVGATPELLLSLRDGHLTSRVLAGTTARGGDAEEDRRRHDALLRSAKDLEEHRYALESLTAALEPHVATMTTSRRPYLLRLSNVAHLASDLTGAVVEGRDALELLAAAHPSAAVGGTPRAAAVSTIRELEGLDRGRYAGPVGWLDARGDGEWGIALRCAQLDGRTARLFAGCGIVAGSEPDAEVLEAQAKFVPVRDALEGVRG